MILGANWGARAHERTMAMACDRLLADAQVQLHRGIWVDAPRSTVFRWLCQLRLAPYSYDLIDNLGRRSPPSLVDGIEQLEVGQRFMSIFSLVSFEQDRHITLRSRRVAVTYAVVADIEGTRLLARVLYDQPRGPIGAFAGRTLALGDLVMMRKQLLTLKRLAEREGP